jgi:osmoprotectant transport system ATP-binding protein
LIKPDTGTVTLGDEVLSNSNLIEMRRKLGYVIQDGGLFPHLTAEGNIALLARYTGKKEDEIKRRIKELCELTKFPADGLNRFPAELSGGQKQRVSLMRALMPDPEFLLFDEPLGALDPLIRYDLQTDLKEIFRTLKKTVLLVTHDLGEAGFFGDNIVLMRDGKIIQQGSLNDFVNKPAESFVTQFVRAQRSHLDFMSGGKNV